MQALHARAANFEEIVTNELHEARDRGMELAKALAERDATIASLNGQLDDVEAKLRAQIVRTDVLGRDKARIEARAVELFDENSATRRESDRLRRQLEQATAKISDAQSDRERAQSNLIKLTNSLAECQLELNESRSRDAAYLKELNELRGLLESHQEGIAAISDAREQLQCAYEEIQRENQRLRNAVDAANAERHPSGSEPDLRANAISYRLKPNLVNVPR